MARVADAFRTVADAVPHPAGAAVATAAQVSDEVMAQSAVGNEFRSDA